MNAVSLYIYDEIDYGITPFTADTTVYTADTDLFSADATELETGNQLYARRIELYNDELIQITSSVQDIKDISKVKTDYSQSFTVPASKVNNSIFKHWYESAVDDGFDHRVKYKGFIEIDTIPFKFGGFALNSASVKNNRVESYNITFYGDAKNIKDLIKEDKINSLDYSELNHDYTPSEVIARITGDGTTGVTYPLFAHDRLFSYGDGQATDVTTNTGAILWRSLFPAVKVDFILRKIQEKYGITFTGAFLNYSQFNKLELLFKNSETIAVPTLPQQIDFVSKDAGLTDTEVNLDTDVIGLQFAAGYPVRHLSIRIIPSNNSVPYSVNVFKNGQPFLLFSNLTGITNNAFFNTLVSTQNINDTFTIKVSSETPLTFDSELRYRKLSNLGSTITESAYGATQTTQSIIDVVNYAPDIKIMDFLAGLIKMFNMTIIPQTDSIFEFVPLELYYNDGKLNDISKYVISDDVEVKKTSMYKNINFMHEKSENILNEQFRQLFTNQRGYDYGDLKYEQIDSLETNTYDVKTPFENVIYERETDTNFLTVTFKNKDLNNYVPKPVLMYNNGDINLTTNVKINTESGYTNIASYVRFSNEYDEGGVMTLNWGEEVSPWYLDVAPDGLYKRHYSNYIGNVFSLKGRLLNVKAKFNPVQLNNIKLNDRIVIRDKKYTINTMTTNLTTGEVDFELLSDYRTIGEISIGNRYSNNYIYEVGNNTGTLDIILLMAGATTVELIESDVDWIHYDLGFITESTVIEITLDPNTTGTQRIGNVIALYDGVETLIPIIQNANLNFSNTTVTFDNTFITFDNDDTTND